MGSRQQPGIKAYCASIGLKAPCTGKREDWRASDSVHLDKLYNQEMKGYRERHQSDPPHDIRKDSAVRNEARVLFDRYGPEIWGNQKHRPWLFSPGPQKHGVYERHLYYEDAKDREFLQQQFVDLFTLRLCRQSRHYHSCSLKQRFSTPASCGGERKTPQEDTSEDVLCIERLDFVNLETCVHIRAETLQAQGVWLGDWENGTEAVNGAPWPHVQELFKATIEEGYILNAPYLLQEPETDFDWLSCTRCGEDFAIQIILLEMRSRVGDGEVFGHVWAFPCFNDNQDYWAIVQRPHPHLDNEAWEFWKTDGSFTSHRPLNRFSWESQSCKVTKATTNRVPRPSHETHDSHGTAVLGNESHSIPMYRLEHVATQGSSGRNDDQQLA